MTLHHLFGRRDPAVGYDLSRVEQGDELLIGFPHGVTFLGIVLEEPWDHECRVMLRPDGCVMTVPSTLVLSHRERGSWQEGRQAA